MAMSSPRPASMAGEATAPPRRSPVLPICSLSPAGGGIAMEQVIQASGDVGQEPLGGDVLRSPASSKKERLKQPQLRREHEHQAPNISEMKPVTREAYGGGMYANEEAGKKREPGRPRASATQSADGIEEPVARPKHTPPPSTGDRDLDITGMSYIQ